jgi:hypothetical protein
MFRLQAGQKNDIQVSRVGSGFEKTPAGATANVDQDACPAIDPDKIAVCGALSV